MPPDADLVREARRGAKEAMAELLHRHWDTAVVLAGRVLGSPDLARDAAQEAAVAAMTDLERLRSPDRFGAWFCGVALNVSRRWRRQLQPEVPGLGPDLASVSADTAETAEAADTAARVRGAIAALADGQQDAVRLFYLQGLGHRGVAAELGISIGGPPRRTSCSASTPWSSPSAGVIAGFPSGSGADRPILGTTAGSCWPHLPLEAGHFGSAVPMSAVSRGASTKTPFWKLCCQDESAPRNAARSWRRLNGVEMSSARGLGIGA
jgi:RNA polymerase sigma factor (sigma-70 family)